MAKKNNKLKIHVTKGDVVQIISGDYKGKTGVIKQVLIKTSQVIIENTNLKTKHLRPKKENEVGKIIQIESPIHSSNVMLYSKNQKISSRYTKIINKNNYKQRILKKTNEVV